MNVKSLGAAIPSRIERTNAVGQPFKLHTERSSQLRDDWADIDLQAGTVRVHRAVVEGEEKGTKTRAGVRTIPLLLAARQALEDQRQRTEKAGGRVFMNPRNDKEWTD
jgi:hypothetical protein